MTSPGATPRFALAALLLSLAACTVQSVGDAGNREIYEAWRAGRSHVEVEGTGVVARVLGTRNGPSGEHEGFLLHLTGPGGHGLTVRVESNLDLMGSLPVREGRAAIVRGEYEYDPRGGVIHWTHRDPSGRHPGGFVEVDGRRYD
jgi:hypothetical protein